jgi:ASPIC and UnbV/AhpC/TSA family
MSRGGEAFADVSAVSGADDPADARSFALLDYDRDGWLDLAVVNANAPLLQLFRNEWGTRPQHPPSPAVIAFRFVGGNHEARPQRALANRDGYGALVDLQVGDRHLVREHRAGEGFAAQNSATLLVGLGDASAAREVTVRWPSGTRQTLLDVPAGSLVTLYEVAAQSPDGSGALVTPYLAAPATLPAAPPHPGPALLPRLETSAGTRLRVLTTFATWCEACVHDLPLVTALRDTLGGDGVALFGLPIDGGEPPETVAAWTEARRPAYRVVADLTDEERAAVKALARQQLRRDDTLPTSFVTDAHGRLVQAMFGVPTVSDLRRLLAAAPPS